MAAGSVSDQVPLALRREATSKSLIRVGRGAGGASPSTATAPNRKSPRFCAISSDEYPMIVVSEQNVTALPGGAHDRTDSDEGTFCVTANNVDP